MDDLGLEQAGDRFDQGVVIGISDTADRRGDFRLCQAFSVLDRQILRSAIRVVHQLILCGPTLMNGLIQSIEDKFSSGRATDTPPNDAASKDIDDEGHIDTALPCRDVGEVADPEHVWRWRMELSVHLVQWAWERFVWDRRLGIFPRTTPSIPISFISRATVQRATSKPSLRI